MQVILEKDILIKLSSLLTLFDDKYVKYLYREAGLLNKAEMRVYLLQGCN